MQPHFIKGQVNAGAVMVPLVATVWSSRGRMVLSMERNPCATILKAAVVVDLKI
jgi:hypothetical protein